MRRFRPLYVLAFVAATSTALTALAQGPGRGLGPGPGPNLPAEERVELQLRHMTDQLGLTTAQQEQIRSILVERAAQVDAVRQNSAEQDRARREAVRGMMRTYQERIDAILTPEQIEKADRMRAEARSKARGTARRGRGAPPEASPN